MNMELPSDSLLRPAIIIGGGVGPMAGVSLHQAIIRNTCGVSRDSDHIDVWHIAAVGGLPDRTGYLLGLNEDNPARKMAGNVCAVGGILASQRREWVVGVPCATFHSPRILDVFQQEIQLAEGCLGLVNMIDQCIDHLCKLSVRPERIGVLSTKGSYETGVWRDPLAASGFEAIDLPAAEAELLHAAIYDPNYGLKAVTPPTRRAEQAVLRAGRVLLSQGAQALVLGCTELPFVSHAVANEFGAAVVICDPVDIQAKRLVSIAKHGA